MGTNLNDMKRNTGNTSFDNFQNTNNLDAMMAEIKQDVIGMDKHFSEYKRKIDDAANEYKKQIATTTAKLTRMVS